MSLECPECGAHLCHTRTDDGFVDHDISKDGIVQETASNNNGSDSVYCSDDSGHEIPDELINKVLDLVEEQA